LPVSNIVIHITQFEIKIIFVKLIERVIAEFGKKERSEIRKV